MHRILFAFLVAFAPLAATGQTDSLPTQDININQCRRQLIQAFERNDRPEVQFWADSLRRLEDNGYLALYWDERWLIYLWLENYAPLFSEVVRHNSAVEELALYKISPPKDSLFERLDTRLFEDRLYLFDQVRKAWLSAEERAFASLLVSYLLRLNVDEQAQKDFDAQLDGFLKAYPKSRFAAFIRAKMYHTPPPDNWGLGLDILFLNGSWSGELERYLRPLFGVDMALFFSQKRFTGAFRFAVGGQRLARPVVQNRYEWPEDDPSTFLSGDVEIGYDIINKSSIRIFPTIGGGFSSIHPPTDEATDAPEYYEFFKFRGWHYQAALHTDIKFPAGKNSVAGSYHGVRVRVGHRWLNLDKGNPAMSGNMFFVAVGYTIFGQQARTTF